ncbi:MAG: 2-oxoacid:acceptor oxidoreductase subunit alpha [Candidatus Dojkabacteria bacterium]
MRPNLNRFVIKFAGESGQGINSVGEILARAIKDSGYYTFSYREYPSLIQGGHASYQLDISNKPLNSSTLKCDILICVSRKSIYEYLPSLNSNGLLIHSLPQLHLDSTLQKVADDNKLTIVYVNAPELATLNGGSTIMANTALLGVLWQVLTLQYATLQKRISQRFGSKPALLETNLKVLEAGYKVNLNLIQADRYNLNALIPANNTDANSAALIISGNHALSLGAIAAGLRAYYAYPMTPSSSILTYLADTYKQTGILVKQAEDEITAAQMSLGSMHMGARSMVATSGGGFDLMTETITLAGMTETPFVCVLAQRSGPATGLPTWTGSDNLEVAIYGGHGDMPRAVLAISDPQSAYTLIQKAFNLAEEYQIPVIVLTDKQIAESLYHVEKLSESLPIERWLVTGEESEKLKPEDRYKVTEFGVSKRWVPGSAKATYLANSDEHDEKGNSIEDAATAKAQMEKRMLKMTSLKDKLEEPEYYGDPNPDILFVGWGSVKNVMQDLISLPSTVRESLRIGYLHYENIFPVKVEKLNELAAHAKEVILIENNYTGQLGKLLAAESSIVFTDKLLKYDGRAFFIDELVEYINKF